MPQVTLSDEDVRWLLEKRREQQDAKNAAVAALDYPQACFHRDRTDLIDTLLTELPREESCPK